MHLDSQPKSYHRTKMMFYFDQIIDYMIANPGAKPKEIGNFINRAPTTVSAIINSDMFKARLMARRSEWVKEHDFTIQQRTVAIAEKSMDLILEVLEKKRDQVPLGQLLEAQNSALERLGFGIKQSPAAVVQVNQQNNSTTVVLPPSVPASVIAEARMAVRQAQQEKLTNSQRNAPLLDLQPEKEPPHEETPPQAALTHVPAE